MAQMLKCRNCGKFAQPGPATCEHCGQSLRGSEWVEVASIPAVGAAVGSAGGVVVNRYRDAYRVSTALLGLGNALKAVGAIVGVLIVLGSFASANSQFGGGGVIFGGVLAAAVVGGLFWVFGVIVAAQGQILRAQLDSAVATSRFLTDGERAEAMGLPAAVVGRVDN
jgi:hypothetical protein